MAIREINLIDPGILVRRQMLQHLIFWGGGLIVALAMIGGFYLFQAQAVLGKKSSRGSLQQVHADLALKIEEINRRQAEVENLRQQQNALRTVIPKQPFYRILAKLAGVMNAYTWITQLALDIGPGQDSGSKLQLTGLSRSNEDLGDFMNSLADEAMFKDVVLQLAKEGARAQSIKNSGEAMPQIQFKIECSIDNS
ncbi:MAG: PilN domain-containing protein [Candidatus Desulfatibia sp.]|jgi:Tfp pilus assembly protein PilN|uniref:PilN domain-containing protein n=1 Tax=Candidatus Desulfatibia sp. TaxID=3101189 RepID=UPI002F2FEFDC